MNSAKKRILTRTRKKRQIRKRIQGTKERPRISVFRSTKHIYAQAIDDDQSVTLFNISTTLKDLTKCLKKGEGKVKAAELVGKTLGAKLIEIGVKQVVFDRNGYLYHGRVKSIADGIREAGVKI
ncbi:MAG: 50S ribosomal protein L18 [Deltaproteobacteria bacterium]|nr:50S ribosomal protein L18 [Deltaproteobacteria bacterium]